MKRSTVHIAGVGIGGIDESDGHRLEELSISAATKAMLDAGITYSDVDQSFACLLDFHHDLTRSPFDAFGMRGTPVSQVENAAAIRTAFASIAARQADCALVIGLDKAVSGSKVVTVALVLVSQDFLNSRAYLKDSSIEIKSCVQSSQIHSRSSGGPNQSHTSKNAVDGALRLAGLTPKNIQLLDVQHNTDANAKTALLDLSSAKPQATAVCLRNFVSGTGLTNLCGLVWQMRGWGDSTASKAQNALQFTSGSEGTATVSILNRSNGEPVPDWETIQNLRDGRERMGYNPFLVTRPVSQENFDAVRARPEFTTDDATQKLRLYVKGGDRAALSRL